LELKISSIAFDFCSFIDDLRATSPSTFNSGFI
jgi:hypothetical protein